MAEKKAAKKSKIVKMKPETTGTGELPAMEGPGVGAKRFPDIDALADKYQKARDRRVKETPHELSAKTALIDAIHSHADEIGRDSNGEVIYRYENILVSLKPGKETLTVKALTEAQIE